MPNDHKIEEIQIFFLWLEELPIHLELNVWIDLRQILLQFLFLIILICIVHGHLRRCLLVALLCIFLLA